MKKDKKVTHHLKVLMQEQGISIIEVSESTGISYPTLKRFFSDNSQLTQEKFMDLLKFFDIDILSLVEKEADFILAESGKRPLNREDIFQKIGNLLSQIKPYKVKPLVRLIFNSAERTQGIDIDNLSELKRNFKEVF